MNPLLAELAADQSRLLEVIFDGYRESDGTAWPVFQYVDRRLRDDNLDARSVALTCPTIHFGGLGHYGWLLSVDTNQLQSIQPEHRLGLTVAGLTRLPSGQAEVQRFLAALDVLVARERSFTPSAREVQHVEVRSAELLPDFRGGQSLRESVLARLPELLKYEPATWHCQHHPGENPSDWTLTLGSQLRWYEGIQGGEGYVGRLVQVLQPPQPQPLELYASSLSLPEAIDYLNAVWRLGPGNKQPLITIGRAEAAAKLALGCATADEFDSRLSGFCGMLAQVEVPETDGASGGALNNLKAYLEPRVAPDSMARVSEAIDDLRAFAALRAWRQHPGADLRGADATARLGLTLPPADWGEAWRYLQARAVAALSALREEIEGLDQDASAADATTTVHDRAVYDRGQE